MRKFITYFNNLNKIAKKFNFDYIEKIYTCSSCFHIIKAHRFQNIFYNKRHHHPSPTSIYHCILPIQWSNFGSKPEPWRTPVIVTATKKFWLAPFSYFDYLIELKIHQNQYFTSLFQSNGHILNLSLACDENMLLYSFIRKLQSL